MGKLARRRCRRKGHDWLLSRAANYSPSRPGAEFIPVDDICLRCGARRTTLPWGWCLGDHPIAEHYDPEGNPTEPLTASARGPPTPAAGVFFPSRMEYAHDPSRWQASHGSRGSAHAGSSSAPD